MESTEYITSCGLCLTAVKDGEWSVLVIKRAKEFELPKGRMEDFDQNRIACALREIREEAGLSSEVYVHSFLYKMEYYWKRKKRMKRVFFFLAFPFHFSSVNQPSSSDTELSNSYAPTFLHTFMEEEDNIPHNSSSNEEKRGESGSDGKEDEEEDLGSCDFSQDESITLPSFGSRELATRKICWVSLSTLSEHSFRNDEVRGVVEGALQRANELFPDLVLHYKPSDIQPIQQQTTNNGK